MSYISLTNANASEEAKKLYEYLQSIYGKKCLTGQMESVWRHPDLEMDYILEKTGKLPAIRGLDFISNDFDGVAARSIEWHKKGGIVTICWHTGPDFASNYDHCKEDNIEWKDAFDTNSETYRKLIEGMDRAVPALTKLRDAGVPVLWRPFHELDGDWFWWGRGGSENFVKLWKLMYERYTNEFGLNNLIWVYGYSEKKQERAAWYPGKEYVDLVGPDSYNNAANNELYDQVKAVVKDTVPMVLHENGTIPSKKELTSGGRKWLYFMTWHTRFLMTDEYNTVENIRSVYADEYFITLDQVKATWV